MTALAIVIVNYNTRKDLENCLQSLHDHPPNASHEIVVVDNASRDGSVEAVSVRGASAFAVGVQWHPEYWAKSDDTSARLFRAFGDAVRAHAAARRQARPAAE